MRRQPLERVTVRAPAKVNLHLAVGRRRADGFHDLTTVFQAVGLYDELDAVPSDALTVTVTGAGADDVPTDRSNLAVRAAALLGMETGRTPNVALTIRKDIPVAGGCAGGSADAAAALVACDALWGTGLGRTELAKLAARLGSDVPFSLHGGTALGTGRGEQLTPVLGSGSFSWVLALADRGLSTPDVYEELDRQRETGPVAVVTDAAGVLQALRTGDAVALGHALSNDLQPAAVSLRPQLAALLEAGREVGALGGLVSGSGPTVAFLARNDEHAVALSTALQGQGACRSVRRADGPVPGARVVEVA
ncbi:MAG: 4-(cytidine 5'-diphospho)-2-C-methyl-D-erythritol kinase [Actinobacteria bacterium]|nr:4-(cytidine 5'-diphospho)-2-C-methyl-D-erythritol kinase [Actinomycetota bacterium]